MRRSAGGIGCCEPSVAHRPICGSRIGWMVAVTWLRVRIDRLPGYGYASPVRVGNSASTQMQIDVWGEVLDTLHLSDQAGLPKSKQVDFVRRRLVEHLAAIWDQPDAGLWESRDEKRHYTYSRVMAWVGIDRFLKANRPINGSGKDMMGRLSALRDQIHGEICNEAWNPGLRAFTQYYVGQKLDAGLLLLPLVCFLPANDPRMAIRSLRSGETSRRAAWCGGPCKVARAGPKAPFFLVPAGWRIV